MFSSDWQKATIKSHGREGFSRAIVPLVSVWLQSCPFNAAVESFRRSLPAEEFKALDAFERLIGGPLCRITPDGPVCLIVDGWGSSHATQKALNTLARDHALPFCMSSSRRDLRRRSRRGRNR